MSQRRLAPCLSSPNCVSTQAMDEGHAILLSRAAVQLGFAFQEFKEVCHRHDFD